MVLTDYVSKLIADYAVVQFDREI